MSTLVTVVAGHVHVPVTLLWTVTGKMTALVAIVAARVVRRQATIACNVAAAVTAVATIQILLAVACKVTHLVALVTLLTSASASELTPVSTRATGTTAAATSSNVLTIAGIVTRPVALKASISRHFTL